MTAQQEPETVEAVALLPGNTIRLEHHHEVKGKCLAGRGAEGRITKTAPAGTDIAIHWEQVGHPETTGVCVLPPTAFVLRTGHMAAAA